MKPPIEVSQVRPFTEADIEQVGELHRRVFGSSKPPSLELLDRYRTYFLEVFLNNPWSRGASAMVYEEKDGTISGFMGSVFRPMLFKSERIQMRIGTQFIVDPRRRGFAGLKLLRALFAGPQDLTLGDEGNLQSRGLWDALGGFTAPLYSMRWHYPIKPCEAVRLTIKGFHRVPRVLPRAAAPLARALDAFAAPALARFARKQSTEFIEEDPDAQALAAHMAASAPAKLLRPYYDGRSLEWVLARAQRLRPGTELVKRVLRTDAGNVAGWYIYAAACGGVGDVLQLHANPGFETQVLDNLFENARARRVAVLSGRMEPGMIQAFADRHCLVECGPEWVLVRSSRPELLEALWKGEALLSKLEGEWCLRFQ
jgi:hypothetical protein